MKFEKLNHFVLGPVDLWNPDKEESAVFLEVKDGVLLSIAKSSEQIDPKIKRLDGQGYVLLPVGVDAQVHLRVPGQEHKETAETGLRAALKGGYGAVLTMPNTNPIIDTPERLLAGKELTAPFERQLGVEVYWTAAITKNLNSSVLTPIEQLASAGMKALTNDGLGVLSDSVMDEAFARLTPLGIPLLQHAEFLGHGGSLAPSSVQKKLGAKPYPESAELDMLKRDLEVLKNHPKARYHLLHATSRHAIPMIQEMKERGFNVTCEVTPHHLYFSGEDIDPENKSFKMNPPLRSPEDREAFWEMLEDGRIDFVSTDHAPHEALVKEGSFDECAFGTIGMETTLGVLTWGYKKGLLSKKRFVQVFSQAPSRFLRLDSSYGKISEGEIFRAILFDTNAPSRKILASDFESLSKNSCFIGSELPGRLVHSFLGDRYYSF